MVAYSIFPVVYLVLSERGFHTLEVVFATRYCFHVVGHCRDRKHISVLLHGSPLGLLVVCRGSVARGPDLITVCRWPSYINVLPENIPPKSAKGIP